MSIQTSGRTDLKDFFEHLMSGGPVKYNHTPFLVFHVDGPAVSVNICSRIEEVLAYPDETKVMQQWRGEWRSDFFQFTVGQLRAATGEKHSGLVGWVSGAKVIEAHLSPKFKPTYVRVDGSQCYDENGSFRCPTNSETWEAAKFHNSDAIVVFQSLRGNYDSERKMSYQEWQQRYKNVSIAT